MPTENLSPRQQDIDSEITPMPNQSISQPPQDPILGVERVAVDEQFTKQIRSKKNSLIEGLREQSLKYQFLPATMRCLAPLFITIFPIGVVCMLIREFIAGGVLMGSTLCFTVVANRMANNYRIKLDQLRQAEGQVALIDGQVVSPDKSGHFRPQEGRDPNSVEGRLLRINAGGLIESESSTTASIDVHSRGQANRFTSLRSATSSHDGAGL